MAEAEFSGMYSHNIDSKGRVTIPSAYREALGDRFTLGINNDFTALALYPESQWKSISERLNRIPVSDAKGMRYVRMIKAFSYPNQETDSQGRVLLPQVMRQKAGMDRSICFVGVGRYLEIWDERRFMEETARDEENFDALLDYVNDRYFGKIEEASADENIHAQNA